MEFSIKSLRGGMNNTDPSIALPEDQCVSASNVEYIESMLGERRKGTDGISLPSILTDRDRVPFLFRHLPTANDADAELWALGVSAEAVAKLARRTDGWNEVTISDTPNLAGFSQYRWQGVTLHGKLHLAYDSDVDRLHVWDGSTLRRSGLAAPAAAPTAADAGSGSLAGTRYGRVRYAELSGSTVLRRSEPSDVRTFAPTGSGASITWTKPAAISEGETHWEIELSVDNANFYRMARIAVATTTHSDTVAYSDGYAATGTLSEDTGDYTPAWSARYLTADEDRLIWAGSWESDVLASRVGWSPVYNADGVGNDERYEADTDPTLDLDTFQYGAITGISAPVLGGIWVFKQRAIYKLTRSGQRSAAYIADKFTDAMGAIHGSVMSGLDESGQPCLYFIDQDHGPCRIGIGGIKRCGEDVRATWQALNTDATKAAASCVYYPTKKQALWCIATGSNESPTVGLVLHTDKSRTFEDGIRKGWAVWTGTRASALSMCLWADNIEDATDRSLTLVPFIGLEGAGLVHRCDTGTDDNGTAYAASITTKPYVLESIIHQFEVRAASVLAKATASASLDISCTRDYGLEETVTVAGVSLAPTASETSVIRSLDNFVGSEMHVAQFTFEDVTSPAAQWHLHRFDVIASEGQRG